MNPANIHLLKVNSRDKRKKSEICLKLIKTLVWLQWCLPGVFIDNFEHIAHIFLVPLSLILKK